MDESDFSDGNDEDGTKKEEVLDPDNPDHYFPLMERNFTKVNRADGNLEHIYPAFRF